VSPALVNPLPEALRERIDADRAAEMKERRENVAAALRDVRRLLGTGTTAVWSTDVHGAIAAVCSRSGAPEYFVHILAAIYEHVPAHAETSLDGLIERIEKAISTP
jgi:hypothetical protein